MMTIKEVGAYHYAPDAVTARQDAAVDQLEVPDKYTFWNFFHPFVNKLINKLNQTSVAGMLDPVFLKKECYEAYGTGDYGILESNKDRVELQPKGIDLSIGGPYANYNWELLYHIPVMIAVHLSNNQRFAEAQRWFHYVFDPTCTDTSVPPPLRFWKFLAFRNVEADDSDRPPYSDIQNINT